MRRNVDLTKGLIFSGQLLLDLTAAGMLREDAYRLVQRHAMHAWETEGDFRATAEADPVVQQYLSEDQLDESFSVNRQLRHVDTIFKRVFPET
jgi:adenylosuccinate lyase